MEPHAQGTPATHTSDPDTDATAVSSPPGDGDRIDLTPLETMLVKLHGSSTAQRLEVIEFTVRPGGGPPLHLHRGGDEIFYVLAGTLSVRVGTQTVEAAPGTLVHVPRGTSHAPFNPTDEDVRALIIGSPAGFVPYFEELQAVITGWPPTAEMLEAAGPVMARHGVEMTGPPPLAA